MCADKQPTQQQVEDVLTHELVHAYDHCRFGVKIPPDQKAVALLLPGPRGWIAPGALYDPWRLG